MSWVLDKAHSAVGFSVKHMMISTVRGRFSNFEGSFKIDPSDLAHSYVEGKVSTGSIDTGDDKRDGHLRSPDFFDSDKYPTMEFRSTKIESKGGDRYQVTGELTIKDVTNTVVFDATEEGKGKNPWGKEVWAFSAALTINRKDFGLNWNVALEAGGWLVSDTVKITLDLEMVNEPESVPSAA